MLVLKHRLRLVEVPVRMREREHGSSSITFLRSVYYAFKVTLALLRGDGAAVRRPVGGRAPVTPVRISIAAAVGSMLLLLIVLELIRGRRLKERYALLWLVTGLVLLVLSAWRGGLNTIAGWLGVSGLSARDPLRGRDHVRDRGPAPLLDRPLAPHGRQRPPRPGGGAPAGQARRAGKERRRGLADACDTSRLSSRTRTTRRRTRRTFRARRSQAAHAST